MNIKMYLDTVNKKAAELQNRSLTAKEQDVLINDYIKALKFIDYYSYCTRVGLNKLCPEDIPKFTTSLNYFTDQLYPSQRYLG